MKTVLTLLFWGLPLLARAGDTSYPPTPPVKTIITKAKVERVRKAPGYASMDMDGARPNGLPTTPPLRSPDRFFLSSRVTGEWEIPKSQFMKQMLKDIDAAKATGNTAEYEALTKRYAAWADKCLRHESKSPADTGH
jgi:hypothetical protein